MNNKELASLLKLMRKNGVLKLKNSEIELELSPLSLLVEEQKSLSPQEVEINPDDPWAKFPVGDLSPEQLMFYSAGGEPGEEPEGLI